MKYSRPPSLLRSSSVPVSCVMGWLLGAAVLLPFSHSLYSILLVGRTRADGRAQSADGLNCSIFRYGPTLRTDGRDGRTDNVVRGCALGLRRRRRRRSKRSTHNENVGAGYCRRQSLSLSWSSLPLYGFVSSALLPTAILREYGGLARRYRSHVHSRRPGLVYPEAI